MKIAAAELKVYDDIITINYRKRKQSNYSGIEVDLDSTSINKAKIVYDYSDKLWKLDNGDGNLYPIVYTQNTNISPDNQNNPVRKINESFIFSGSGVYFYPEIHNWYYYIVDITQTAIERSRIYIYDISSGVFVDFYILNKGENLVISNFQNQNYVFYLDRGKINVNIKGIYFTEI